MSRDGLTSSHWGILRKGEASEGKTSPLDLNHDSHHKHRSIPVPSDTSSDLVATINCSHFHRTNLQESWPKLRTGQHDLSLSSETFLLVHRMTRGCFPFRSLLCLLQDSLLPSVGLSEIPPSPDNRLTRRWRSTPGLRKPTKEMVENTQKRWRVGFFNAFFAELDR